jgi:molybdate transport system substrate-binding protein
MHRRNALVLMSAAALGAAVPARADEPEIRLLAAGAVAQPFKDLLIDFARESSIKVEVSFGPVGVLQTRIKNGVRPDVAVLSEGAIAELEGAGLVAAATRAELGRGTVGVAVRADTPPPDIATPEAVKRTMLAARAIAYPDPAGGGTAGVYFVNLMKRFGIADDVKKKALLQNRGSEIAAAVADGSADIGVTFISELLPNKEVRVVGAFPPEIGLVVPYVAAVLSASRHVNASRALIAYLTRPAAREKFKASGL